MSCPSMSLCSTMFTASLSPPNLPAPPSQPVHCRACSLLYFCCIQEIKCRLEQVLCFLWAVPVYLSFLAGRDLALADPAHPPKLIKNNVFLPLRKGIGRPGEMKRFSQAQNTKGAAELLCLQDSLLLQLSPPPRAAEALLWCKNEQIPKRHLPATNTMLVFRSSCFQKAALFIQKQPASS